MPVDWTPHRFSAGVLALDLANTVVHRFVPAQRFDRLAEADEIVRFAQAACLARPDEHDGRVLAVADPAAAKPRVTALREATDTLFRAAAQAGHLHAPGLERLLRAAADCLAGQEAVLGPPGGRSGALALEAALGLSALSLLPPERWRRIRICPACAWLFLDGSRNGSRRWCDMAVCGNRHKARRSYQRRRSGEGTGDA